MTDPTTEPANGGAPRAAEQHGPAGLTLRLDGPAAPATLPEARAAIDEIDAALAVLLERRAGIAAVVQRLKPVGGFAGRDPERERRIVEAMALRAPSLGAERLSRIMAAVIEAGLEAAEDRSRRTV
ncbi:MULTISPECIES: chorismate mutase [Actinomadura]|uniref:Chorismate mutase n=1 Tax=Actinomadura yumaensis TaxID=111807 RepID=A0ABW2CZ47_9ACTN|nr:chorismate mutase [Actinomadura sp. J1-007]MWK32742.1 chorismate mutase [Actinomadura sp. J1-007]